MRWIGRLLTVSLLLGCGYVAVTATQVVAASRRDSRDPADAILVLGAAQYDGRPSPALRARLDHAAELFADGVASVIWVTGGQQRGDRFTEASASADYLTERGVPADALVEESTGRTSYESLQGVAAILADRLTLGAIVERVGSDRLVRWATVGAVAGSGLFALGGPGAGAVGLVIAGFWLAPIFPTLISRTAGRLPPGVAAHAVGFKISAAMVGVAVVPLVAGVAAETFGLEAVGFVAAATAASLLAGHEALLRMSSSEHSRNATPLA